VDARSDIYSFGATFYEMLTGRVPLTGPNEYAIMHAHLNNDPVPPVTLVPGLPAAISDLILKALAKSPEARFQSAREFQDALRDAQFGGGPAKAPAAPGRVADPFDRRRESRLATADKTPVPAVFRQTPASPPPALQVETPFQAVPLPTPPLQSLEGHKPRLHQTGPRESIDPNSVTRVQTRLAGILGPIAKNLVSKAAPRHSSLAGLCQELAEEIQDPGDRAAFLKSFGASTSGRSEPPRTAITRTAYTPAPGQVVAKGTPLTEKMIETAREALTQYLGPIATVIVKKAAKRAGTLEELRDALAAEITDARSQAAFLRRLQS
jgi:serine/threonine protein kinase